MRNGFNQLKQDMGFTQVQFYCFKKKRGRVFHIMTNKNTREARVVTFFTNSDTMPVACGSFSRLPNDNSSLAANCDKWGHPTANRWGHSVVLTGDRLFKRPIAWSNTGRYIIGGNPYQCDDNGSQDMSLGDT